MTSALRYSKTKCIREVELLILEYLRDCADLSFYSSTTSMWQSPPQIRKAVQEQAPYSNGQVTWALAHLQKRIPRAVKRQQVEPTNQRDNVYRITREGRMILLDVEYGQLMVSDIGKGRGVVS